MNRKSSFKRPIISAFLILLLFSQCADRDSLKQEIYTGDIGNFWNAYDQIAATNDSSMQYQLINELYINKGSQGLINMMIARNYTAIDYLEAINNYPKFWASIRSNTELSEAQEQEIIESIQKLQDLYPDLKPAPIYFTIGALRSGGTILNGSVLIGSELSFADKTTYIDELPEWRQPFFLDYIPIDGLPLLCTHEYVHTQQSELVDNLLSYCIYEGVAEFISTEALGIPSNTPAIQFGKENERLVKEKFEEDLFIPQNTYNWIWGENQNELKVRDLGYYIGYSICENFYANSSDKDEAIKEMISLDFNNEDQIESFVDASNFLSDSIHTLYAKYEVSRPSVLYIEPLINDSKELSSKTSSITINFSSPMNKENTGFDFGPLGEGNVLKVQKVIGFSEDGKSFTFEVDLEPDKHYQSLVTNRFISKKGIPLKPFLIDFKTK